MNELILTLTFISSMTVTSYRSVPAQTDSSPYITSIGEKVNKSGVAASQDLLKAGTLKYGDIIYVEGYGLKVVNDTMHPRMTNHIDMWVKTKAEEHKVGTRTLRIYKIKGVQYEEAHQAVRR